MVVVVEHEVSTQPSASFLLLHLHRPQTMARHIARSLPDEIWRRIIYLAAQGVDRANVHQSDPGHVVRAWMRVCRNWEVSIRSIASRS
jgi:hypothetical protein